MRSYSELCSLETIEERFRYLSLKGAVGEPTFGTERYVNQNFYTSRQWRQIRHHVIARDAGCDLGLEGFEVFDRIIIHHMNPMSVEDIVHGDDSILDPEFLISTALRTHNAIHYGTERLLPQPLVVRTPNDTRLW